MICRPSMDNKWTSKHSIHVAIGYLLPACITTLALIMEFTLDECNPWKPRFGEGSCFFAHKKSKWLWLFGPITVMLALNIIGCIMIVTKIWRQNRKRDKLGLQSRNQQTSKMDKCAQYFKIAIGMGIIWTFEILSQIAEGKGHFWYFTDVLNMLQGVYIFWSFVCTRRVFTVVFGRRKIE